MVTEKSRVAGFHGQHRFLSNFWPSKIDFEGIVYPTVEHAYQAAKTTDNELRKVIAAVSTASEAKSRGRMLALRYDWDDVKVVIMKTLLRKKFYDSGLKLMLLGTGTTELVETNYWHDNFWGSCVCRACNDTGENWLGKLLMDTRTELRPIG